MRQGNRNRHTQTSKKAFTDRTLYISKVQIQKMYVMLL